MTARTHDAIAFASLITVAAFNPPENINLLTLGAALVGNIIGSTLPDMDVAGNRIYKFLPWGGAIGGRLIRKLFLGHRAISHSIIGFYAISFILKFLMFRVLNPNYVDINLVYGAVMIGYISHLVGDALTKEGLPLFYPIKWKIGFPPISALRITTGSWVENLIILPGSAAYVFWFIGKNQQQFMEIFNRLQ